MKPSELRRAAAYLAADAEGLRAGHTIKRAGVYHWPDSEPEHLEYREMLALAAKLRSLAGRAPRPRVR